MISAGHQWPAIQTYTLPQLRMFVDAAAQQQKDRQAAAMIAARLANASAEDFKQALRELDA